jgi:hypothetical protein
VDLHRRLSTEEVKVDEEMVVQEVEGVPLFDFEIEMNNCQHFG